MTYCNLKVTGSVNQTLTGFPPDMPGFHLGIELITRTASLSNSGSTLLITAASDTEPSLFIMAQGGLSVAGGCRCLTKDGNTSIEKEGYIPYPLQA